MSAKSNGSLDIKKREALKELVDDRVMNMLRYVDEIDFKPCRIRVNPDNGEYGFSMTFLVYNPYNEDDMPESYLITSDSKPDLAALDLGNQALELPRRQS